MAITITEILADAFNRVKTEHGVTLSRVDFEHYSGDLSGVTFKADGAINRGYPYGAPPPQMPYMGDELRPQPHQMPAAPSDGGELVELTPESIEELRMSLIREKAPEGATHYGALEGSSVMYWKYHDGLLGFRVVNLWAPYTSLGGKAPSELVRQLTPLK